MCIIATEITFCLLYNSILTQQLIQILKKCPPNTFLLVQKTKIYTFMDSALSTHTKPLHNVNMFFLGTSK